MQRTFMNTAKHYQVRRRWNKTWKKITMALASVVVFATTYALILPAITMEPEYICGKESHLHSEACYQLSEVSTVSSLICTPNTLGVHEHTTECYDENGELKCGIANFVLHTHNIDCFDANGVLLCTLPEIKTHVHDETCFHQPHIHEAACYIQQRGELVCALEEGSVHTHLDACYTQQENLICTLQEREAHTHTTEACYEETKTLLCAEPEVAPHTHSDSCYTAETTKTCSLEEVEGHLHTADCFAEDGTTKICALPEVVGHAHTDTCFQTTSVFTCTLSDAAGHHHGDACYSEPVYTLTCPAEETEGHTHSLTCRETVSVLTCAIDENIPHAHTDACFVCTPVLQCAQPTGEDAVAVLTCEKKELILHTHEATCFDESGVCICSLLQVTEHVHGDTCFVITQEQAAEPVLSCGYEEEHVHIEECVAKDESTEGSFSDSMIAEGIYCGIVEHSHQNEVCCDENGILMCTMTEHTHDWRCYLIPSDPTLMETAEDWEAVLPELGDRIATNLISVAESQLGYQQIEENYIIENDERLYYSRYADWWSYGEDPYGDWSAKFVAFCLDYAGITSVPLEPETATWPAMLEYYDQWNDNDGMFQPIPADLLFLDTDGDDTADRVGITTEVNTVTGSLSAILEHRGMVQQIAYDLSDSIILGYARIPGNELVITETTEIPENVQAVIDMIDQIPSADELDVLLEAYDATESDEDLQAYMLAVTQVQDAYRAYCALSAEEQPLVTNADKLQQLEYIWSQVTLEEPVVELFTTNYDYDPLPYATENTTIHLFDYGPNINTQLSGQALLPFYRIWPEYSYTVDGEASWDHDTTRPGYIDQYPPILETKLGSNGYPVVNRGADGTFGVGGVSTHVKPGTLQYLFDPDYVGESYWDNEYWLQEVRKNANFNSDYTQDASTLAPQFRRAYLPVQNDGEGTGLFQRDADGYWYYDSSRNAAWYNPSTEKFELYNYTVIPGHEAFDNYGGGRTNGNFLPFNLGHVEGLTDYQTDETKVHNNGGDSNYNTGEVFWDNRVTASVGDTVDGYKLEKENFRLITSDRTNAVNVNFGMTVEFDFYMPKDGKINGKDMVFEFSGDDDVWVYIDNVLVLDIGGCHDAQFGSINFADGTVSPPGDTAGYYNNTTIKEMYTAAGVSTASFDVNTYADYTVHTLKFFYMERGGNVSNCYLRFNMPQIEKNTINVTKALEPDQDVDLLGSPDYYFSVLELNSSGVTNRLFIGPTSNNVTSVTGITTYKVKNPDGSYVTDEDGKIKVFTVEQYGIFSIKAGQTAVFEGVPANAGNFYVQEMIKSEDYAQYPSFAVNNGKPQWNGLITWDARTYYPGSGTEGPYGCTWYGVSGPTTNASANSAFIFEQQNRVDTDVLGELKITKEVLPSGAPSSQRFKIYVEMDDAPIPVGTTYKVGTQTRTVGIENGSSYIELAHDEIATLSNIFSGTTFRVWESEDSAKGYIVSYSVTYQNDQVVAYASTTGINGTVGLKGEATLKVTNNTTYELPATGGGGTAFWYYTGGATLLAIPTLWRKKRRYRGRRVDGG